jgi:hypothetical protein
MIKSKDSVQENNPLSSTQPNTPEQKFTKHLKRWIKSSFAECITNQYFR